MAKVSKKKSKKKAAKKSVKKTKKKGKTKSAASKLSLPTERKAVVTDVLDYTFLFYGREKVGKTSVCATFPKALFLATEPGTKGLSIYEFNHENGGCKDWATMLQAVDLLEKTKEFKTVVIDTVDRAYEMCLDYVCVKLGIPHPGTDSSGEADFGKSWKEVRNEFTDLIHRILQTGRGLIFTSHVKEEEVKEKSGDKYTRIYPSMSNQARKVVEALVDLFFYCDYMRGKDGHTLRVMITEGDETVWAGHRKCGDQPLPIFIPMDDEEGFDIIQAAFNGEDVGLNPDHLMVSRKTSKAAKEFIRDVKAGRKGGRKKSSKKKVSKLSKKKTKKKAGRRRLAS